MGGDPGGNVYLSETRPMAEQCHRRKIYLFEIEVGIDKLSSRSSLLPHSLQDDICSSYGLLKRALCCSFGHQVQTRFYRPTHLRTTHSPVSIFQTISPITYSIAFLFAISWLYTFTALVISSSEI